MESVFVGIGSNLGDRKAYIIWAVEKLRSSFGSGEFEVSSIYETDSWGGATGGPFLNTVAKFETNCEPVGLIEQLKVWEGEAGRLPAMDSLSARPLDLDILMLGERIIQTEQLTIPHPRLLARRFVLEPLAEIAGGLQVPGTNATVMEALRRCTDPLRVEKYSD